MPNLPVNKKSFSITNRTSKSFSILLNGFQFAASLFFRIRDRISITFESTVLSKITATFNISRIRLTISQMKLITSLTQIFNLRKVIISFSVKEIGKIVQTIILQLPLTFVSSAIQKLVISMIVSKVVVVFTPILAVFFTLGDFDPDTLGDLDVQTLGDLDYVT